MNCLYPDVLQLIKWCLFSGPKLTWLELDAREAQVIVPISVQSYWVHSVIFSDTGTARSLTHSSFAFKTIGRCNKKRSL